MSLQNSPPGFNTGSPDAVDTSAAPYALNSQIIVGAVILLILVLLFVLMLHMYVRWVLRRSPGSLALNQGAAPSVQPNVGLDKAAIARLPTFVYTAISNSEAGKFDESSIMMPAPECAVCLSEFQENEKGRILPACKHMFHTECIDMWFFSHSTCPLCRTHVDPAMATSTTETTSTDQQPEAMEPSQDATEGNALSQEPMASISPSLDVGASARALPHITVDIPPFEGDSLVIASECLSAKCRLEQEAGSSQPLKSPSLRASIKRMLSRQSSRHKNPSQEGNEDSSK